MDNMGSVEYWMSQGMDRLSARMAAQNYSSTPAPAEANTTQTSAQTPVVQPEVPATVQAAQTAGLPVSAVETREWVPSAPGSPYGEYKNVVSYVAPESAIVQAAIVARVNPYISNPMSDQYLAVVRGQQAMYGSYAEPSTWTPEQREKAGVLAQAAGVWQGNARSQGLVSYKETPLRTIGGSDAATIAAEVARSGGGYIDRYLAQKAIAQGAPTSGLGGINISPGFDKGYDPLASVRGDEVGTRAVLTPVSPAYVASSVPANVFKSGAGALIPSYYNDKTGAYELKVGTFSTEDKKGSIQLEALGFGKGGDVYFFSENTPSVRKVSPIIGVEPRNITGRKVVASVAETIQTGDVSGLPIPFRSTVNPPQQEQSFTDRFGEALSRTVASIPGGMGIAMAINIARGGSASPLSSIPSLSTKPGSVSIEEYNRNLESYGKDLETYNVAKAAFESTDRTDYGAYGVLSKQYSQLQVTQKELETQKGNIQPSTMENIGLLYGGVNKALAPYTTDISGLGKVLGGVRDFQVGETPTIQNRALNAVNVAKNVYIGASESPLEVVAGFAGGAVLGTGLGLAGRGVAAAATSDIASVSVVGRALSTPLASDIGRVAMVGAGALFVGIAGKNVMEQPTTELRSQMLGKTSLGFASFPVGFDIASGAIPSKVNPYSGLEFFSAKPAMGPIEKATFELSIATRAPFTSEPAAYRDVAVMSTTMRFVEPGIRTNAPNIEETISAGKYADVIRQISSEQPTMIMGSTSVRSQYTKEVVAAVNMRVPKDIDIYAETPSVLGERFTEETGLKPDVAMDIKPFKDIPGFRNSVEENTEVQDFTPLASRLFGDPYARLAVPRSTSEILFRGEDYGFGKTGETAQQGAQVQMGGKGQGASRAIEQPMERGYRGAKDIYDLITTYDAQRMTAIQRGTPASQFAEGDIARSDLMTRELTFGSEKSPIGGRGSPTQKTTTETVRQIYERLSSEVKAGRPGKNEAPDAIVKGIVSSEVSSRSAIYPSGLNIADLQVVSPSEVEKKSDVYRSQPSEVSSLLKSPSAVSDFASFGRPAPSQRIPDVSSPSPVIKSSIVGSPSPFQSPRPSPSSPTSARSPPSPSPSPMSPQLPYPSPIPSVKSPTPPISTPPYFPPPSTILPIVPSTGGVKRYGRKLQVETSYIGPKVFRLPVVRMPGGTSKRRKK